MKRILNCKSPGVPHLDIAGKLGIRGRPWKVLLAAVALLAVASSADAATFLLDNGSSVEGEIVHATRNTLMVKLSRGGGVKQLARSSVESVEITTSGGETVSGTLESWANGVYEIDSNERLVKIEGREVVAEGNPTPPVLTISKSQADESATEMTFDIGLSRPSKKPILVIYATLDRTAKAGEDFLEKRGSITLKPGNTSALVKVLLINDGVAEDDEFFEVFVATDQNVAIIKSKRAIGTILNDDE
jgi:hypothetical protein